MDETYVADYALVPVLEHLGPSAESLDVPWATFTGDSSTTHEFTVSTVDAADAYLELQAYDVGTYGHDVLLNDEPLSGFDLPPGDGWEYWMDVVSGAELQSGTNTLQFRRDESTNDAFAVGNVVVRWRRPVE